MAQFLTAGIRVAEQTGAGQAIARAPAATAAFVGRALRGPVNRPVVVTSFAQFQAIFGGLWQPSTLSYAIEQYFENGGETAIIVRVINGARPPTLTLPTEGRPLTLIAQNPGTREFLRAAVDYDGIPDDDRLSFNLTLQRVRAAGSEHIEDQEIYRRISGEAGSARNVELVLSESELARVLGSAPKDRALATTQGDTYVASNPDGHDGLQLTDYDLIGSAALHTGVFALADADEFNRSICRRCRAAPRLARARSLSPAATAARAMRCCWSTRRPNGIPRPRRCTGCAIWRCAARMR